MKRILGWLGISLLVVFLTGCYKDPIASFTMSASSIEAGESVTFTNTSADMERCEWIFGDGGQSTETSPTYTYDTPGNFEVTLRVFGKDDMKADLTSKNVQVTQPTTLWVNVVDYDGGDAIQDCWVMLYDSYTDWYNLDLDQMITTEKKTNYNGKAEFKEEGLETSDPIFINVYKEVDDTYFYCNWFIQYSDNCYKTTVEANKINEVTIRARLAYSSMAEAVQMTE